MSSVKIKGDVPKMTCAPTTGTGAQNRGTGKELPTNTNKKRASVTSAVLQGTSVKASSALRMSDPLANISARTSDGLADNEVTSLAASADPLPNRVVPLGILSPIWKGSGYFSAVDWDVPGEPPSQLPQDGARARMFSPLPEEPSGIRCDGASSASPSAVSIEDQGLNGSFDEFFDEEVGSPEPYVHDFNVYGPNTFLGAPSAQTQGRSGVPVIVKLQRAVAQIMATQSAERALENPKLMPTFLVRCTILLIWNKRYHFWCKKFCADIILCSSYVPKLLRAALLAGSLGIENGLSHTSLEGVVVFADISGYSKLAEMLDSTAAAAVQGRAGGTGHEASTGTMSGPEIIRELLDQYFGALIDMVEYAGGDVIKVAGDGIVVVWPSSESDLAATVVKATRAMAAITRDMHDMAVVSSVADVSVKLSLHAGLAAGRFTLSCLGGRGSMGVAFFTATGQRIDEATSMCTLAIRGQLVVTDEVKDILISQSPEFEQLVSRVASDAHGVAIITSTSSSAQSACPPGDDFNATDVETERGYLVRPATGASLVIAPAVPTSIQFSQDYNDLLCPFINPAVVHHLMEFSANPADVRMVSILFMRVSVPIDKMTGEHGFVEALDEVAVEIQGILHTFCGNIKEFGVDDKGTVLVAGFGAPPISSVEDSLNAVKCALQLQTQLVKMGYGVAIGVTSGVLYCGSVGSRKRREYAMVGAKVNLAARLMMAALKLGVGALCDKATFTDTSARIEFKKLHPIAVKGREEKVLIFQPLELKKSATIQQKMANSDSGLGTEKYISRITDKIRLALDHKMGCWVNIEGGMGAGKTKAMYDIIVWTHSVLKVQVARGKMAKTVAPTDSEFLVWGYIFQELLGITSAQKQEEWEEIVSKAIEELNVSSDEASIGASVVTWLVMRALSNGTLHMSNANRAMLLWLPKGYDFCKVIALWVAKLSRRTSPPTIIMVDNAQSMSPGSWVVCDLLIRMGLVVVTCVLPDFKFNEEVIQIYQYMTSQCQPILDDDEDDEGTRQPPLRPSTLEYPDSTCRGGNIWGSPSHKGPNKVGGLEVDSEGTLHRRPDMKRSPSSHAHAHHSSSVFTMLISPACSTTTPGTRASFSPMNSGLGKVIDDVTWTKKGGGYIDDEVEEVNTPADSSAAATPAESTAAATPVDSTAVATPAESTAAATPADSSAVATRNTADISSFLHEFDQPGMQERTGSMIMTAPALLDPHAVRLSSLPSERKVKQSAPPSDMDSDSDADTDEAEVDAIDKQETTAGAGSVRALHKAASSNSRPVLAIEDGTNHTLVSKQSPQSSSPISSPAAIRDVLDLIGHSAVSPANAAAENFSLSDWGNLVLKDSAAPKPSSSHRGSRSATPPSSTRGDMWTTCGKQPGAAHLSRSQKHGQGDGGAATDAFAEGEILSVSPGVTPMDPEQLVSTPKELFGFQPLIHEVVEIPSASPQSASFAIGDANNLRKPSLTALAFDSADSSRRRPPPASASVAAKRSSETEMLSPSKLKPVTPTKAESKIDSPSSQDEPLVSALDIVGASLGNAVSHLGGSPSSKVSIAKQRPHRSDLSRHEEHEVSTLSAMDIIGGSLGAAAATLSGARVSKPLRRPSALLLDGLSVVSSRPTVAPSAAQMAGGMQVNSPRVSPMMRAGLVDILPQASPTSTAISSMTQTLSVARSNLSARTKHHANSFSAPDSPCASKEGSVFWANTQRSYFAILQQKRVETQGQRLLLQLPPLSLSEIATLTAKVHGANNCAYDVAHFLRERTRGVPLFVRDWSRSCIQAQATYVDDAGTVQFVVGNNYGLNPSPPVSMLKYVAMLREGMSASAGVALSVGALIGRSFSARKLFRVYPFDGLAWEKVAKFRKIRFLQMCIAELLSIGVVTASTTESCVKQEITHDDDSTSVPSQSGNLDQNDKVQFGSLLVQLLVQFQTPSPLRTQVHTVVANMLKASRRRSLVHGSVSTTDDILSSGSASVQSFPSPNMAMLNALAGEKGQSDRTLPGHSASSGMSMFVAEDFDIAEEDTASLQSPKVTTVEPTITNTASVHAAFGTPTSSFSSVISSVRGGQPIPALAPKTNFAALEIPEPATAAAAAAHSGDDRRASADGSGGTPDDANDDGAPAESPRSVSGDAATEAVSIVLRHAKRQKKKTLIEIPDLLSPASDASTDHCSHEHEHSVTSIASITSFLSVSIPTASLGFNENSSLAPWLNAISQRIHHLWLSGSTDIAKQVYSEHDPKQMRLWLCRATAAAFSETQADHVSQIWSLPVPEMTWVQAHAPLVPWLRGFNECVVACTEEGSTW